MSTYYFVKPMICPLYCLLLIIFMENHSYEHEPTITSKISTQRQMLSYGIGNTPADNQTMRWHPSEKYLLTNYGVIPLAKSPPPSDDLHLQNKITTQWGGADWVPHSDSIVASFLKNLTDYLVPQPLTLTSLYDFDPKTLAGKEFGMVNFAPSWEPHGKRIAFLSFKRKVLNSTSPNLCVMRIGGKPRVLMEHIWYRSPLWSPLGGKIVVEKIKNEGCETFLVDVDTSKSRCILRTSLSTPPASYGSHGETHQLNPLHLPKDRLHGGRVYVMDWSPDGKRLLIAHGDGGHYAPSMLDIESGKVELLLPIVDREQPDMSYIEAFAKWSPDGKCIAYCYQHKSGTQRITLVDVSTRLVHEIYRSTNGVIQSIAWSPSGKTLAVWEDNQGTYKIFMVSKTGMQKQVAAFATS